MSISPLFQSYQTLLENFAELEQKLLRAFSLNRHREYPRWLQLWSELPDLRPAKLRLNQASVTIGSFREISETARRDLETKLRLLHPWRKGPFVVYGIFIDTEWRSDWKWKRLEKHISPLEGKWVLDVGSGSGYHLFRMVGAGASRVVGLEPVLRYVMQFLSLKKLAGGALPADLLPLPLEDFPPTGKFDTVFSMGVLYHRRSPQDHLRRLYGQLKPGGELVLETLIVGGEEPLVPKERYAKMRNVWVIPSLSALTSWLRESGFGEIRCADITPTKTSEQRPTDWMRFHSLPHFLNAQDPCETVEGYPAPLRAIVLARRKDR